MFNRGDVGIGVNLEDAQHLTSKSSKIAYLFRAKVVIVAEQCRIGHGHTAPNKKEWSDIITCGKITPNLYRRPEDAIDLINCAVTLDCETAERIKTTKLALEGQNEPHYLYCDGSLLNDGSVSARTGFAAVYKDLNGAYLLAALGTAEGHESSNRAEIVGLLAAILCCPTNHAATIYTDSLSTVQQFLALVESQATKKLMQSPNADWWRAIQEAYIRQGKQVTVQWVRAHSGIAGNMAADSWATKSHTAGLMAWQIDKH
ncbi:hypothetical protein BGX26_000797 [Mortierella sp. AD094]|nr:hypothetical protein BGX26_000797 [Mortierella sp. AD094]